MRRYAAPIVLILWIVGSAPFLGRLTRFVQERLDRSVLVIVPTVLFWAAAVAFAAWVARSRRRLAWRNVAALAAGTLWAAVQATALARGRPEESALERMHLVLYGLVALLLYRALLRSGRSAATAAASAAMATASVGVADEFVQWLVWVRVGDAWDCLLNASAAGCGVAFGAGLFGFDAAADAGRPPSPNERRRNERRMMFASWSILVLASAGLLELANLGHLIEDPELGRFRSQYTAARLERLNEERRVRWARKPPPMPSAFQPWHVEDHFLSEAARHVQAREEAYLAEDWPTAAAEQAILARHYPAVLALPAKGGGLRYPFQPEKVRRLEAEGAAPSPNYVSAAGASRIWIWPRPALWSACALLIAPAFLLLRARDRIANAPEGDR